MKWITAFALFWGCTMAYAEGDKFSVPANPKWKEECGSCHIVYPPRLLAGESWQRLMGGLDKHFGANATLSPKDNQEILDFLQRYAGQGGKNSASSLRISDTPWFTREHHEVSNSTWSDPAVKSRANCTACHVNAEHGDWSERGIRMPGGRRGEGHGERHGHDRERDDD